MGIYVFDWVEIVNFTAPFGVFVVAPRMDPELDAFVIPGVIGTRREMRNSRLIEFAHSLPQKTLRVSVCTGAWIYGKAGILDGLTATRRKNGDPSEKMVPINRLARIAPKCITDRHPIVGQGSVITAGGTLSEL